MSVLLLPPDLLENILVLVVRSSLFPGRTALDISHVCSVWRKAALGCPRLWGIIDTRNKKISSLFVSRTRKSTPLDVLVANPYIVKPPSLFSKDDVLRGHPPRRKESTRFSFETVLSCLHNIRFLTLYLSYQELRLFSAVFPSTGMELQLASLTIITTPTWDANGSNSMEQARIATLVPSVFMKPLLLQGHQDCDDDDDDDVACSSTPGSYLKSLTLTDISLPWGEISASLSSLTYLALTSPALRPSLKQIHLILRRTTLLKRLVLDDVFEDAVLDLHSVNSPDCDSFGPGPLRDLSPIFLPHLTSLTYNAPSLQTHWLCLLLSNCIVAPLLDNISFRTPEMGHLYRPVGEECRPLTTGLSTCKCWMFDPSKLIPRSNVTKEAFLGGLARSIDHLMVSRDAYNPIRSGKGRGYRFYIHGAAKNIDAVEYPSLIPFLRAPSVPFHDPRYFRKFERGILLSGYAYACPHFASRIVPSSFSCSSSSTLNQKDKDTYTYTCPNPISALISGFESLAVNLVHVRHLELATGGVEVLLMDRSQDLDLHDEDEGVLKRNVLGLYKSGNQQDIAYGNKKPLGAVRHVTLWGQISSANSECNVYWRGSDIEKIPLSSSQPGCLYLTDVLYLLKNRLAIAQNRLLRVPIHSSAAGEESAPCISEPPLITRLTLRHFKVEFTPELNEAIESLLGCCYDVLHVDLKKRCEQVIRANKGTCGHSDEGGKLELIDCSGF